MLHASADEITQQWVRNKSDKHAIQEGCWFDIVAGAWTVWWIERYCKLYEGEHAGEPALMRCGNPELDVAIHDDWEDEHGNPGPGQVKSIERAHKYMEWLKTEPEYVDWQYDCTMSVFGWQRYSERYKRPIRRFNESSIWIPKKQKKTPTNAAWSLYLTCGDGEQGGKTFGGAKDGNQAKIAADHAINMVEQSEELMAECKINKNESKIVHLESRSFYKPLSSNDSRHKDAKEGINGNIAIDETHVVDREFIEIISRAGISRSEPLLFDFSTAGKNPDGYGKERQDYVREVISGEKKNTRLFGRIYEVPQDTKDEDIKADPLKFGKMANPAWGHTANEDEFLADFEKSCRSVLAFAKFKMYRLNIWQHGASTWLQSDDWTKNAKDYSIEDFYGERVWLSLDMSKTQDMTSLAAMFKDDEEEPNYYQYPFVFLPKAYAIKHEKDVPMFMDWEKSGHLELIKGRIIRQKFIQEKMVWLDENFDVQCLVYDTKFAIELVDFAEELGWECIPMEQNIGHYAKPTQTYEDLLADGRMRHPNHPVLDWQSRHCQVREDSKELKMPVKPDKKGFKKVDAIQGMVMALVGAVNEAGSGNRAGECYEDENFNWMSG